MSNSYRTDSQKKAKENERRFYENLDLKNALLAKKYDTKGQRVKGGDE